MVERSRNRSISTHTHIQFPSQGSRGTNGALTETHTHTNIPARTGGAQPKPVPKKKYPQQTPQGGLAAYRRSADTDTHTPQNSSQKLQGAAESRAQAHTPTPHTPARIGRVHAERADKHRNTQTTETGTARRSRNASPSTHTHTAHHSQGWRGTGRVRTQTQHPTPKPGMAGRS